MTNYEKWEKKFSTHQLFDFNHDNNGILWLKVRAIARKELIKRYLDRIGVTLNAQTLSLQNVELFEWEEQNDADMKKIDGFLRDRNNEWYVSKNVNEIKLKMELSRITYINQGGGVDNSLDKTFVKRYVKEISDFGQLCSRKAEIAATSWDFVQTSWYNNWSSFLIESLFKKNERVIPAVGETKSVDFFIDKLPFDLKVTYLPGDFMDSKFMEKKGNKEFSWVKRQAKQKGVELLEGLNDKEQYGHLLEELELHGHTDVIQELRETHKAIIQEVQKDSVELMKWLYENQSSRLFGAENRLFVVLIDSENIYDSWKMKRAFSIIEPQIANYIDHFNFEQLTKLNFEYTQKPHQGIYTVYSDIIFVVK